MDAKVCGMYGAALSDDTYVRAKLNAAPLGMTQGNFDALKNPMLTLQSTLDDFYNNQYGNYMDQPYLDLQTGGLAIYTALVSTMQSYATAHSLTY
jgi:membrane peptidoglycan carboxypeptidase